MGSTLEGKKFAPKGAIFFLSELSLIGKRSKHETARVVSPDNVPIHINWGKLRKKYNI